ncbi:MAG TPA: NADH-quinone oxidoreductase subunit H, partial [Chloroflexota bacterium]|nr:NADH-quinone oxidoreductase subunit H [Chloroflexota bacterium]
VLIPISLAWILLVATLRALRNTGADTSTYLVVAIVVVVVLLVGSFVWDAARGRPEEEEPAAEETAGPAAGGYPVPPLDAPHYHGAPATRKEVPSGLH